MKRISLLLSLALAMSAAAAVPSIPTEGGWYRIKSHEGNYIGATTAGVRLQGTDDAYSQRFFIAPIGDTGYYSLMNYKEAGYVTSTTGSSSNYWSIKMATATSDAGTRIGFYDASEDGYTLIKFEGKTDTDDANRYLGLDEDARLAGIYSNKTADTQLAMWQVEEADAPVIPEVPEFADGGNWYRIVSYNGNYVTTTGSSIALSSTLPYVNEKKFYVNNVGGGGYTIQDCNGYFVVRSTANTYSITLTNDGADANCIIKMVDSSNIEYVNLQFESNSKYLGSDNDVDGAGLYCDKSGGSNTLAMWQLNAVEGPSDVVTIPADGSWFRIKSYGGNYISSTGDSIALTTEEGAASDTAKFFIAPEDPDADELNYVISDWQGLYWVRSSESWDTWSIMLGDASAAMTVKVTQALEADFVNIQFNWNSNYLGVDNDVDQAGIYCDKGGDDRTLSMWALEYATAPSPVPVVPEEGAWYMIKSYEGNYVHTNGSTIRITTDDDATTNDKKFFVTPVADADGTYVISDYSGLYLTRGSNSWSIALGTDADAAMTVKLEESVKEEYLNVLFTWNSKYLGADAEADDAGIYCDKSAGTNTLAMWQFVATTEPVVVDPDDEVYGDNLLYNGDFEASGYAQSVPAGYSWSPYNTYYQLTELAGWTIADRGYWNGVISLIKEDSGNKYVTYRGYKEGWDTISLTSDCISDLEPGEKYALTFDVNHNNTVKSYNARVLASDLSTVVAQLGELSAATNGWETKTVTFKAPEDGIVAVHLYMNNSSDGNENKSVSFDNVAVRSYGWIAEDNNEETAIAPLAVDETAPAVYYNLQGMRVAIPTPGHVYIMTRGSKTAKVVY